MADSKSTLWSNTLPAAPELLNQVPVGSIAAKAKQSDAFKALAPKPAPQGEQGFSVAPDVQGEQPTLGAAGLMGSAMNPLDLTKAAVAPALGTAAAVAASAIPPLAIAAGIGELVAPKWTNETIKKGVDWAKNAWDQTISPALRKKSSEGSAYILGMGRSLPGAAFAEKATGLHPIAEAIKAAHPLEATEGSLLGTAGQFVLPGLNVAKGAKLAGIAANAAVNALPYAIGQGLDVGSETQNAMKGLLAGAKSELFGTVLPVGLQYAAKSIPAVAKFLRDQGLSAVGIREVGKNIRTYFKGRGYSGGQLDGLVGSNEEKLKNMIMSKLDDFGHSEEGQNKFLEWINNGYDLHNDLYGQVTQNHITGLGTPSRMPVTGAGSKRFAQKGTDVDNVLNDPDLLATRQFFPSTFKDAVHEVGGRLDGLSWRDARNNVLAPLIKKGIQATGNRAAAGADQAILEGSVAMAWKDHIDGVADRVMAAAKNGQIDDTVKAATGIGTPHEVPDLHVLQSSYPAATVIKQKLGKAGGKVHSLVPDANSDTYIRQAAATFEGLVHQGMTAAGAALGPAGLLAAQFVGPVVGKAARYGLQKGVGRLSDAWRTGEGQAQLARIGAVLGPQVPLENAVMPEEPPVSDPTTEILKQQTIGAQAQAQSVATAPPPKVEPLPVDLPQTPKDAAQESVQWKGQPAQAEQPKLHTGNVPDSSVKKRMDFKYKLWLQGHPGPEVGGITREDYERQVRDATGDFNPKRLETWKHMISDQAQAEVAYKSWQALDKLRGVHWEDVFNGIPNVAERMLPSSVQSPAKVREDMALRSFKDSVRAGNPQISEKNMNDDLTALAWQAKWKRWSKEQMAQELMQYLQNKGNVPMETFHEMGLIQIPGEE